MFRLLTIAFALTAATLLVAAGVQPTRYEVDSASRFWIDGSSTVGNYTCEADAVSGYGHLGQARDLVAEVAVTVRSFDCGSGAMNSDFYRALAADAHPAIRFVLDGAETLDSEPRPGAWVRVRTTGTLYLAGEGRRLMFEAQGQRMPDGRVTLQGRQALRMSDFGIDPPSHLLGLIHAHDDIVARFDIVATAH